ncbi:hypothetical protein P1X14_03410 [Sphingomonas sp. AOB5]|uniref:hypothetical protein n=1 Tax=Sphingomonas sp. AOB5 TaxID=3034017 RepID=UPI0023F837F7|nr:hypothetical protein [Sphingomonas sp. AOB5]MDF7774285.1 hypothetical protein [Sphingomonas sp. AOB5]
MHVLTGSARTVSRGGNQTTDSRTTLLAKSALSLVMVLAQVTCGWEAHAQSQAQVSAPPPEQYTISPGGVDMRSGVYAYRMADLSVPKFDLERTDAAGLPGSPAPFASMGHNWSIMLTERRQNLISHAIVSAGQSDYQVYVSVDGRTETFQALGIDWPFEQMSRTPMARLAHTGSRGAGGEVYTYTAADGSTIVFRALPAIGAADCSTTIRCAYASEVNAVDGTKYTLQYDTRTTGNRARLKSVTSSRGYLLLFEYTNADWNLVTKACIYNLAASLAPTDGLCSSAALATTSYSYTSYASEPKLASVTDAAGKVWTFAYAAGTIGSKTYQKVSYSRPDETTPWLVNWTAPQKNSFFVDQDVTWKQDFADGSTYSYNFDFSPSQIGAPPGAPEHVLAGGTYTDNLGRTTTVTFGFPEVPYSMSNQLPGSGTGVILLYHLQKPTLPAILTSRSDPDYDLNVMANDQRDAFNNVLLTSDLLQQAHCNECSGPAGYKFNIAYQITPGPTAVTDALGRTTSFDYCDKAVVYPQYEPFTCLTVGLIQSWTDPEGIRTEYKYLSSRRTESRRIAKPGSGLVDIVESATYSDCTSMKVCQQPLTVTDANQNTTTYTYDPAHGGVLTEVRPAVNGVSPAKKYSYSQRYAWIKNSGGGYSQSTAAQWLLTEVRTCISSTLNLTTGTCAAGTSDLVITNYDYGPDSGPNNLLLRGTVVTSNGTSLRTCYGYDKAGNKISETTPRAELTACL